MPNPTSLRDRSIDSLLPPGERGPTEPPEIPPESEPKVELFTAEPAMIRTGEAATLKWVVTGGSFQLLLNGAGVPHRGERVVIPTSTTIYRLVARMFGTSAPLGAVTVNVDASACDTRVFPGAEPWITGLLTRMVQAMNGVSIRRAATAEIDGTGIAFKMWLSKAVDNFADPNIDVDYKFRPIVDAKGNITPIFLRHNVNASVPWWAWSVPGALPGLAIALGFAKDTVRQRVEAQVTQQLELLRAGVPAGRKLVQVRTSADAEGTIEMIHCPA